DTKDVPVGMGDADPNPERAPPFSEPAGRGLVQAGAAGRGLGRGQIRYFFGSAAGSNGDRQGLHPSVTRSVCEWKRAANRNAGVSGIGDSEEFLPAAMRVGPTRSPHGHELQVSGGHGATRKGQLNLADALIFSLQKDVLRIAALGERARSG